MENRGDNRSAFTGKPIKGNDAPLRSCETGFKSALDCSKNNSVDSVCGSFITQSGMGERMPTKVNNVGRACRSGGGVYHQLKAVEEIISGQQHCDTKRKRTSKHRRYPSTSKQAQHRNNQCGVKNEKRNSRTSRVPSLATQQQVEARCRCHAHSR